MHVLISGAGIAGPTLAYWLDRFGIASTIVERAPALRTAGYIIDFWGAGFDLAERMGILDQVRRDGYMVREVRVVNRDGDRVAGFPVTAFSRLTNGRYVSVPRGALAAAVFNALEGRVETTFGDSIAGIDQAGGRVRVTFERGAVRDFDVVVGADGLHSRVRDIVCGPEPAFERYLGCKVAAFEIDGYEPHDELVYIMYTEIGQQVARFAMRGGRTMFLFIFRDADPRIEPDLDVQKAVLRQRFGGSGWECPRILAGLDRAGELYIDRVSQIRMGSPPHAWSRGRVTLVGDAASCVSLLGGQGSALAMIAAYILADELRRTPDDPAAAFARYEERFGPFVLRKQHAAMRFVNVFAPRSSAALFVRNKTMSLLSVPWIADRVFGREFVDEIDLSDH